MKSKIKDKSLNEQGRLKIRWAGAHMPVLASIREEFRKHKPLSGIRIGACLHVTSETANLLITLKEGGAQVYLSASNPLSTKDDIAASLVVDYKIPVFAVHSEDRESYYENIHLVLDSSPHITLDDGGDLTTLAHKLNRYDSIIGGTEETTTGVIRFKAMQKDGVLAYPIIAVNDSKTKYLFDNRYGTGQSTIDGILRATNRLLSGSIFVVCGYGWCGRGIAMRARGMGARVIVTEVNPIKALEATLDGFNVMPILKAAEIGDLFVTATGNTKVIDKDVLERLKDGAILANSGHFNVEINLEALSEFSVKVQEIRPNVQEYQLKNGKKVYLLADGRLVNLVAAEGHPPDVMDMSFANQALASKYIVENSDKLEPKVYTLPYVLDQKIASLKLKTMGIQIDMLTEEQVRYLSSWEEGT